jgi:thiol:disulfide interchange protein DsbD
MPYPQVTAPPVHWQTVSVPVLEGASKLIVVNVEFQGCADLGVCYPPITKSATINNLSLKSKCLIRR